VVPNAAKQLSPKTVTVTGAGVSPAIVSCSVGLPSPSPTDLDPTQLASADIYEATGCHE
jgi:hypothetical protein